MVEEPEPGAASGLGAKPTVTPEGMPVADRVMALLKPPLTVVLRVEVPEEPCAMLSALGAAPMVKSGTVTVRFTVTVCVLLPPVPVTVMGYVPPGTAAPTVIVMVDDPEPGAASGSGAKL